MMNILIVDDSQELLTLLGSVLERMGHKVKCASSKADAKSCKSFDLAMVDWNLEDGCGIDLIEFLSSQNANAKLILMSATIPCGVDKARLISIGANYEAKPLTPARLMEITK